MGSAETVTLAPLRQGYWEILAYQVASLSSSHSSFFLPTVQNSNQVQERIFETRKCDRHQIGDQHKLSTKFPTPHLLYSTATAAPWPCHQAARPPGHLPSDQACSKFQDCLTALDMHGGVQSGVWRASGVRPHLRSVRRARVRLMVEKAFRAF